MCAEVNIMYPLIKCENLCKICKDKTTVTNLNFSVYEGDVYGLLGPKASGKSTIIKMIVGLIKPTYGKVYIDGYDTETNIKKVLEKIGAMVDSPSFYSFLSAYNNLRLYAKLCGLEKESITDVLQKVGLSDYAGKKMYRFSPVMKQRYAIARALLNRPMLVILDEPTRDLDPQGIIEIKNLIRYLNGNEGITFMLCLKTLEEVQSMCNRACVINNGSLVDEGEVSVLFSGLIETVTLKTSETSKARDILSQIEGVLEIKYLQDGLKVKCKPGTYTSINKQLVLNDVAFSKINKEKFSLKKFLFKAAH